MHHEQIAALASSSIVITIMFACFVVSPVLAIEWGIITVVMSMAKNGHKK